MAAVRKCSRRDYRSCDISEVVDGIGIDRDPGVRHLPVE
jgi:hypothetical protein